MTKIILPDGSAREVRRSGATIEDVLEMLEINPEEVIVAKNSKIVSECETIDEKDEIKVVRIVHGG